MNAFLSVLATVALFGSALAASNRVVGGEFAERGQFPFQAAITFRGQLRCGAVLVTEKFLLTTASCFYDGDNQIPQQRLGAFLGSERLMIAGVHRRIKAITEHENFEKATLKNDLAIVELNKPVEFTDALGAATLHETAFSEGGPITVAGWGRTAELENTSYKLKFGTLNVLSEADCQTELGDRYYQGALCAKTEEAGVCVGDYGGPAVSDNALVGIASYTVDGACGTDKPDVFVDVGYFYDFIKEHTGSA
ncbi:serine protease SP24D-like [Uranotaenia lowii]|uniref:serine protease SP24D-like n=1 Tax=Uranotaenia lowii TaxID=190385 RepID=UPI002478B3C0|nr:serine protease SP24D-like [Uranotaenia lowii]